MKKILKYLNFLTITILIFVINITLVKAANASISVSSSTNKIVVGKTFNVTIKVSSSTAIGSWEFTPSYDSSKLKLVSGETSIADVGDGKIKSKSYSYKFKAISTGSAKITVKGYGAMAWNESKLSTSVSSKTISIISQSELEASYSKNNNLKNLTVEGLKLSPTFSKDTTKYTAEAPTNTTSINIKATADDSKSSIKGTGKFDVSEGENVFKITVTAQNGNTKTYQITINVIDPNPINVTIDSKTYTVVKRESNLTLPDGFEKTTLNIQEQNIPAFYNKTNNYTLVGLSDENSNIELYLYNEKDNSFSKYTEIILEEMKILPLPISQSFNNEMKKTSITINDTIFEALKMDASDFYVIYARNIVTGKDDYYTYDSINNTMVRYTENNTKSLEEKILKYKKMIMLLGIETVFVILVLVCILISKVSKNKKRRKILEEEKKKLENKKKKKKIDKDKKEETKNEKENKNN